MESFLVRVCLTEPEEEDREEMKIQAPEEDALGVNEMTGMMTTTMSTEGKNLVKISKILEEEGDTRKQPQVALPEEAEGRKTSRGQHQHRQHQQGQQSLEQEENKSGAIVKTILR